jgi:hypothetical protein
MHAVNGIALFDLFQDTGIPCSELGGFVETLLHRAKETVI